MDAECILHASAVAVAGRGVVILGPSGSGKSALALRLVALGAELVADDRTVLRRAGQGLTARAPEPLAGLIEARGVGILRLPHRPVVPVSLVVDLAAEPGSRMPPKRKMALLGVEVELIVGRGVPNLDAVLTIHMQTQQRPD